MPCQRMHSRLPPMHRFATRGVSTCGTVWWWTPDWQDHVTDDLDQVTCKRCRYILTRQGIIKDPQLFLPGFAKVAGKWRT